MKLSAEPQPDQQPNRWNDHVAVYEAVFEPLTNAFGRCALEKLDLKAGARLIDIGAGSGGVALMAARNGADVLAIDASHAMIARIRQRANSLQPPNRIRAEVMDGMALTLSDACFDAAVSVFGVILFPDAELGMREIARVLKPGGRAAVVTWTQIERYELASRLMAAIAAVRGPQPPPASMPAQLRFRDEPTFRNLFVQAGLTIDDIVVLQEKWRLPSAQWIADRIAFAPGMTAWVGALGADRAAILDAFVTAIERDYGCGEIALSAVAHTAIAQKPS
ncbi:MAG: methyltransferase domain-containing protein [Rhizobiales bacterium]|nr:methyltransferase domain-containing protein [Hyphomicrobiales bacterium]